MTPDPLTIDSGRPGPSLLVLGGVHGDERCGVDLIRSMMERPAAYRPTVGRVVCAYGNPMAIEAGARCVTHNLNRLFLPEEATSACACFEHERAATLRTLFAGADVLLDIHASFTPQSEPFVICERNAAHLVKAIPATKVCFGFDVIQPGGTDYGMNALGKIGICVECGYLGDPSCSTFAEVSLRAVMAALGMIEDARVRETPKVFLQAYLQYRAVTNFTVALPFADFASVQSGQVIGYDGDEAVAATEESIILFAQDGVAKGNEAFVLLRETFDHSVPLTPSPRHNTFRTTRRRSDSVS